MSRITTRIRARAVALALLGLLLWTPASMAAPPSELLVISYHDIRDDVDASGDPDAYATSTHNFAAHLDWLSGHGYTPVDLDRIVAAQRGGPPLPPKAVLLTFDDGLRSHYTHAYPLLQAYGYPALMAVVTDWVDLAPQRTVDYGPRAFDRDDFMTWAQLREMQASGLVEVASHSHDLHRGVLANPQGNLTPAAITRIFDPTSARYESEAVYRERLRADLLRSIEAIAGNTAARPRAIVWPYAAYSDEANRVADDLGLEVSFDLEGLARPLVDLHGLSRLLLVDNPDVVEFARELRRDEERLAMRAIQVDLDYVYDPDPAQLERNLDTLIERIRGLGPTHVFLQAFADPDGNGSADALYFPNRHLPVRADLYNRVAWQLRTRAGTKVLAWLPVLGYEPTDAAFAEQMRIRDEPGAEGEVYRLDPSDPRVLAYVGDIYEDLAVASYIEGLLFHDDAYLRDGDLGAGSADEPTERTQLLVDFSLALAARAERWRPKLVTVRNLYARPVLQPGSEAWFGQRLDAFLDAYDYTALMAMPWMEGAADPDRWLLDLVAAVDRHPDGLARTVFELQTVDWRTQTPIPGERLQSQMRAMQAAGVRHLGYYPDDFVRDLPAFEPTRAAISSRSFPYPPR
ncbi:poly-beta-1,6-N-acetyl-D-glucosamine N-deacetylase PgaB [Novilysobacter selenitireducens]|uniref:Poly-beta-1,6-N-acetyl-D-glucosamine N-deacetylase PgaB n=1 Tax=Novilysobacter selenitireducens TaxID=2872639 RepID=A0ABS7T4K0_9GAMM|nr:poly-beta-1,6-N-acetyl-D-glucosamine N-deacetylase PgaB [Lysobacter selenitireducens]